MSLLSEKLAPIWSAINRLQARQMSIFPATVTSIDPVRIRIDGESQPLAATPDTGLAVSQGARVRVLRYGTTHLIIARTGPHTGTVPPVNPDRFSRSLRWMRTGNMITFTCRAYLNIDSQLSPGASWHVYQLPPAVAPANQFRTFANSMRNGWQSHGAFLVSIDTNGEVRIYETDPVYRLVAGTEYHFSGSYEARRVP